MATQVTLTTIVMTHPERRAQASKLALEVDADAIVTDSGHDGEWSTGSRAWMIGAGLGTTHVLVLQDDALPAPDFKRSVMAAVEAMPGNPISLYLGRRKPSRWANDVQSAVIEANAADASWISATHLLHGVGIVLPSKWITPMLDWCETNPDQPYDQRIGRYVRTQRNRKTFYTWPSLVDHDDSIPTLVRHDDDARLSPQGRVAWRVGSRSSYDLVVVNVDTPIGAER